MAHTEGGGPLFDGFSVIFVRGSGATEFPQFAGKPAPLGRELEGQFWDLAATARGIAALPSVEGVVAVHPCLTHGWAIGFQVHDYRGVDDAIVRLGAWLARENLQGEVVLQMLPVLGPPEPL